MLILCLFFVSDLAAQDRILKTRVLASLGIHKRFGGIVPGLVGRSCLSVFFLLGLFFCGVKRKHIKNIARKSWIFPQNSCLCVVLRFLFVCRSLISHTHTRARAHTHTHTHTHTHVLQGMSASVQLLHSSFERAVVVAESLLIAGAPKDSQTEPQEVNEL